jgi:hypothetical protein
MRKLALGLSAVLACTWGCGPLATDPVEDGGGGGGAGGEAGGGGGPQDSATSAPPPSDAGAHDAASQNNGPEGGLADTGASPEDSAPPPAQDSGPPLVCSETGAAWVSGAGISTAGWTATASATAMTDGTATDSMTGLAFDNNLTTRWSTGSPQEGEEFFLLNLGQAQMISQVALFYPIGDAGTPGASDFAAEYSLGLSTDGVTYKAVAFGLGASPTAICFPAQSAQYVKISQTGTSGSWFSIYEIQVFH